MNVSLFHFLLPFFSLAAVTVVVVYCGTDNLVGVPSSKIESCGAKKSFDSLMKIKGWELGGAHDFFSLVGEKQVAAIVKFHGNDVIPIGGDVPTTPITSSSLSEPHSQQPAATAPEPSPPSSPSIVPNHLYVLEEVALSPSHSAFDFDSYGSTLIQAVPGIQELLCQLATYLHSHKVAGAKVEKGEEADIIRLAVDNHITGFSLPVTRGTRERNNIAFGHFDQLSADVAAAHLQLKMERKLTEGRSFSYLKFTFQRE